LAASPLCFAVEAVTRDSRFIADDGAAGTDDAIEERRFADIRPADDGENGI